jgi:hypothetical protein
MERRRFFTYSALSGLVIAAGLWTADKIVFELKRRWVISAGFQAAYIEHSLNQPSLVRNLRHLILGDSTMAMNFATPRLSRYAVSSTLFGSSSPEAYYLLKRWLDRGARPKCVLLGISYGGIGAHLKRDQWWIIPHTGLFDRNALEEIRSISIRLQTPPAHQMSRIQYQLRTGPLAFWFGGVPLDVIQRSLFNPITRARTARVRKSLFKSQGWHPVYGSADQHSAYNEDRSQWVEHLFDEGGFEPFPLTDYYLEKIYDLAEERRFRLIQVYGPLSQDLDIGLTHNWHKSFRKHLTSIHAKRARTHSQLQLELTFVPSNEAYDPSHLYIEGARKWTDRIISDIKCSDSSDFAAPNPNHP